jgi:hypothetical protein
MRFMNKNLRYAGIAALILLVLVPIIYSVITPNPQFAMAVLLEVAIIGFFTVIFVMVIGSQHGDYPSAEQDSAAVTAWSQREAAKQAAKAKETVEKVEE